MTSLGAARARAPGRVNLIGEHVDYHDLPVLPMALELGVEVVFTPRDDGTVRLRNREPAFEALEIPVTRDPPRGPEGGWGNYARAAVGAVADLDVPGAFGGLDGEVVSDLPRAAGLSSSSALVVAVALALASTHRDPDWSPPEPTRWATLLAEGERYVGTAGGGMDQAASLGGRRGEVLRIAFDPVRWSTRRLPEGWAIVVAHSGVHAEKSGAARRAYNALRARGERARDHLADRLDTSRDYRALRAAATADELIRMAREGLDAGTAAVVRHVLGETQRVEAAWQALPQADLDAFGSAMNASHESLARHCGVSHPRLDALVGRAREAGAAGARLTGAGFGGCIVALTTERHASGLMETLVEANRAAGFGPAEAPVFRARPGEGAGLGRR
jgi:galactokinase